MIALAALESLCLPDDADLDPVQGVEDEMKAAAQRRKLRMVEPELNLIAALLNLTAVEAAEVLSLVRTKDFIIPVCEAVSVLIRHLAINEQQRPTPQAVAALARRLGNRLKEFHLTAEQISVFVVDAYTLGNPITPWHSASQVVEDSYRRQFEDAGTRLAQMAEACAPIRDLERYTASILRRLRSEHARLVAVNARAHH